MTASGAVLALAWVGAAAGPVLAWLALRRRRLAIKLVGGTAFAVLYGLAIWTFLVEPRLLAVRQVEIASPTWSGPPLRLGLISDTHSGAPYGDAARLRRIVAALNAQRPDLILLLGDYAGDHEPAQARSGAARSEVMGGVAELGRLSAPLGKVAVLGNHDWWYDGPALERALREAGAVVLENEPVRVPRAGGAFWVAGLADEDSTRATPSPRLALEAVPLDEPALMISHWPDPWPLVPARVAATFAGHTHCGQVNLPLLGRLIHASDGSARWPCGLYVDGARVLFVTGGTGISILPVRFRAPPEVVVVTLRQGQPGRGRAEEGGGLSLRSGARR